MIDSNNPNQSIKILEQEIKKRTRKDKEFWFIDISVLKTMENAKVMLDNLLLDIDDDFFTFKYVNHSFIEIWEIYKLVPEKELIVKKYGTWKSETGLLSTSLSKWQRRRDLTVSLKIACIFPFFLSLYPYIQIRAPKTAANPFYALN